MPDQSNEFGDSSESNGKVKATEALVDQLQSVFTEIFDSSLDTQFRIVQDEDGPQERDGPWKFKLSAQNGSENGRYEFDLRPISADGEDTSIPIYLKVNSKPEEGRLHLDVKGKGKGKWKKFELLKLSHIEGEGWRQSQNYDGYIPLKYNQRKFSSNVLEVWFPQREEEGSSILQIPVHLEMESGKADSEEMPEHWARFADEGVEVALPEVEMEEGSSSFELGDEEAWKHASLSFLMYWVVCNVYASKDDAILRENETIPAGFPPPEKYRAERPVNLNPTEVIEDLEADEENLEVGENDDKLYLPWHVIESACSALNAGKNVIFTGPPGCGKSKLASFLAEKATGQKPLMTTASPAWSTGDLIGRYMPDREGDGLVFREGVFLRAIGETDKRSKWLVIDEFNRADIDSCFGELFSILADDAVELPFEKEGEIKSNADGDDSAELSPVRVAPEGSETDADYLVPETFRLIGTMNDADRSGLSNLSFALMRRLSIIPVESPDPYRVKNDIIKEYIGNTKDELQLESNAWDVSERGTTRCDINDIRNELDHLFASDEKGSKYEFQNLVSESIVGISVVGDVIRFVGEGMRTGDDPDLKKPDILQEKIKGTRSTKEWAKNLTLSYLALATVLQIFPQLEALGMGDGQDKDKLSQAVNHIFDAFHLDYESEKLLMLRVEKNDDEYVLKSEETISEFLSHNLDNRFPPQAGGWREE